MLSRAIISFTIVDWAMYVRFLALFNILRHCSSDWRRSSEWSFFLRTKHWISIAPLTGPKKNTPQRFAKNSTTHCHILPFVTLSHTRIRAKLKEKSKDCAVYLVNWTSDLECANSQTNSAKKLQSRSKERESLGANLIRLLFIKELSTSTPGPTKTCPERYCSANIELFWSSNCASS